MITHVEESRMTPIYERIAKENHTTPEEVKASLEELVKDLWEQPVELHDSTVLETPETLREVNPEAPTPEALIFYLISHMQKEGLLENQLDSDL